MSTPKKILLVDDDLFIRELYDEVLKSEGYDVDTASDGKEGFDKITENQYDLILLDVMLPKIDGIGILSELKKLKNHPPLSSIIFLTNLAHDPVVKQVTEQCVRKCLIKADITPDQLVAEVKAALGK